MARTHDDGIRHGDRPRHAHRLQARGRAHGHPPGCDRDRQPVVRWPPPQPTRDRRKLPYRVPCPSVSRSTRPASATPGRRLDANRPGAGRRAATPVVGASCGGATLSGTATSQAAQSSTRAQPATSPSTRAPPLTITASSPTSACPDHTGHHAHLLGFQERRRRLVTHRPTHVLHDRHQLESSVAAHLPRRRARAQSARTTPSSLRARTR